MYSRAKYVTRRIKVVMTGGLGDCLLATPFIRHFKTCGDYDRVTCITPRPAREIFDRNPFVDELIVCSGADLFLWAVPEKDCDVFSPYIHAYGGEPRDDALKVSISQTLHANLVSVPIVRQVARYHNIALSMEVPELFTKEEDDQWARQAMTAFDGRKVILFHPSSELPEKNLSDAQCRQIVRRLETEYHILQLSDSQPVCDGVHVLDPAPSIRQSAALFAHLDGLLTVDSFPGHLAKAIGTAAVVLFGPSNPNTYGHQGNLNITSGHCPPCANTPRKAHCSDNQCMRQLPLERIIGAVKEAVR